MENEVFKELKKFEKILEKGVLPKAQHEWSGADVVISHKKPSKKPDNGFYPAPRYLITRYSLELSWLFERIRDAFYAEKRLDGCSKIEFFGRLANAANRCIKRTSRLKAHFLYAAVLHEAFAIYDEMEEGNFRCFVIAAGNEIVDDYIDDALRSGYIGTEATIAFFKRHGVEVKDD